MARSIDFVCDACGKREWAIAAIDETRTCACGQAMTQDWLPRVRRDAQWDDATSVLVFRDPATGQVRYPGTHDAKMPAGYERVYLRSLREVERFEREQNVRSEMAWFDKGSGRGFDDKIERKRAELRNDGTITFRTYEESVSH